jgi:exodeoxyribonuclease V alpha subunit
MVAEIIVIECIVKKVKYSDDVTGWSIVELIGNDNETFIAKGALGPLSPGYKLELIGDWVKNKTGAGVTFDVKHYTVMPPSTIDGIFLFLSSGLFKGLSKAIARNLVDVYQERTLGLLDNDINVLRTIPGVGAKKFIQIRDSYRDSKPQQEKVFRLINDYGFTFSEALSIVSEFPENAINVLENAPYSMCRTLSKIPFVRFDRVMLANGLDQSDPHRVREVILHQMKDCYRDGHTMIAMADLLKVANAYLRIDPYLVHMGLSFLLERRRLFQVTIGYRVYIQSKWFFTAEKEIANRLSLIQNTPAEKGLSYSETDPRISGLKGHQRSAVFAPFKHKVSIITGRPGSGKTTLLRVMLDMLESHNLDILTVSPTGKAAQRLREVTGRDCTTIHRALGATHNSDEFTFNDINPLSVDVILLDESSMSDTSIMRSLLRALPYYVRIVFIGDVEQLPSVAPGKVFKDLIDSLCIPTYWLTEVLRITKKDGSLPTPLMVSYQVLDGKFDPPENDSEWAYHESDSNESSKEILEQVVHSLIDSDVSYEDVQVFSPVNNGDTGVGALNKIVKKCFFPSGSSEDIEVLDKVMQKENNYDLGVFNGDIGIVKAHYGSNVKAKNSPVLLADVSGRLVEYTRKSLYYLVLAYVISGHKSQGSEYPHVIILLPEEYFSLMDRYWLYTLITRCKVKVHLIGSLDVIGRTVRSRKSHLRVTNLSAHLHKFMPVINEVYNKDF